MSNYVIDINYKTNWSLDDEQFAKDMCDMATCYIWVHDKQGKQYRYFNNAFNMLSIVSSLLTLLIFFINDDVQKLVVMYKIFGVLSTSCAFICAVQQYSKRSVLHELVVRDMKYLHKNIQEELKLSVQQRREVDYFIRRITQEFERIEYESKRIGVSERIMSSFNEHFSEQSIKRPNFDQKITTVSTPRKQTKRSIMSDINDIVNEDSPATTMITSPITPILDVQQRILDSPLVIARSLLAQQQDKVASMPPIEIDETKGETIV